eukprot:202687_1
MKLITFISPALVVIGAILSLVAIITSSGSLTISEGTFTLIPEVTGAGSTTSDPFLGVCQNITSDCEFSEATVIVKYYLNRAESDICYYPLSGDPSTCTLLEVDRTYDDFTVVNVNGNGSPFLQAFDGCSAGSLGLMILLPLGIAFALLGVVHDIVSSINPRLTKPNLSTFVMCIGAAFMLGSIVTWVLTCQQNAVKYQSAIQISAVSFIIISAISATTTGAIVRCMFSKA